MRITHLCLAALLGVSACASRPIALGPTAWTPFEHWRVERRDAPTIDAYVAMTQGTRPLVVFAQGSKCLPLFMIAGNRRVSASLFVDSIAEELDRIHFAAIERRGLESFTAPPSSEEEAQLAARCSATHGGVSKQERVRDLADAIVALRREAWVSDVYLLGHSEGGDVVAGVAAALGPRYISGVGLLSGAGATRFFDDLVMARQTGGDAEVKAIFDEIIRLTRPGASGEYRGAPVDRQITYAIESTPLADLQASPIPVFVASGTRDEHVPIAAADLFVAELLRNPDRQIRYHILPGLDHGYVDEDGEDRSMAVLAAFIDWALDADKGREVVVGLGAD